MSPFRVSSRAALAAALLAAACGDGQSPGGSTRLSIVLTDAPGDILEAVVTIEAVQLVGNGPVLDLTDGPTTLDLLTLADATADLVTDATVPSGTYGQLRFIVSGAYIAVENDDGSTSVYASSPDYAGLPAGVDVAGQLVMPSFAQTGIKVTLEDGALTLTGDAKILLVDFDVEQSFGRQAGQSGLWVMTPVITGGEIETAAGVTARAHSDRRSSPPEAAAAVAKYLSNHSRAYRAT